MKTIRLLFVMLLTMMSVGAWGYANGDIITPKNKEANGFTFMVTDKDNLYLSVYACSLTDNIIIPAEVRDSNNTVFKVISAGGDNVGSNIYEKVTGSITLSEGIEIVGTYCFNRTKATELHLPKSLKTYSDNRTIEWVNNFL